MDDLVKAYNDQLSPLLDRHAPICTKVITLRPDTAWYTEEIRDLKHERRRWERKWRETKLEVHHDIYREVCRKEAKLIASAKRSYYSDKIQECGRDQKHLFRLTKTLMGQNGESPLPRHPSTQQLTEEFSAYFINKITDIRENIDSSQESINEQFEAPFSGTELSFLAQTSEEEVTRIIARAPAKSCELDPIPTWLLKKVAPQLVPLITAIINRSLETSFVPDCFKKAIVRPLLKKPTLDPEQLKCYRPVSNLAFISKLLEKIVDTRIKEHLQANHLHEEMQSAYRRVHSTETALLKVHSDIMMALDRGQRIALVMLDLSAAFDTLDQNTLLRRVQHTHGITGEALKWLESYFSRRSQAVTVNKCTSSTVDLPFGVPQGSVLGPKFYSLYTKPLGALLRTHQMHFMIYADDTQLYSIIEPKSDWPDTASRIERCLIDISNWMSSNCLKLNHDKSEFIIFSRKNDPSSQSWQIQCGDSSLIPRDSVRNLGVIFDSQLQMERHVNNLTKTCFHQLRNISKIRRFINKDACRSLVQAAVTSRLDYANSLLYGVPKYLTDRLQRVQNAAARVVCCISRRDHITPTLVALHWLPVRSRIEYKILLLTFKAMHDCAPSYICGMITQKRRSRSTRSVLENTLEVPNTRTVRYGDRSFTKAAPYLWNKLPATLRNENSLEIFKRKLKTYLFVNSY